MPEGQWTRGLLIRRHVADGDLAFFTTWCPAGTSIETLVAVDMPSSIPCFQENFRGALKACESLPQQIAA